MEDFSSGAVLVLIFAIVYLNCEFELAYYNFTFFSTYLSVNAVEFTVTFPNSPPISNGFACEKIKANISSIQIHWFCVFRRLLYKRPISLKIGDVNTVFDLYRQAESPVPSFVPQSSSSYASRSSSQDFFIKNFFLQSLQCSSFTSRFDIFNPGYRLSECAITFSVLQTEFAISVREKLNHLFTTLSTPEISLSINYPKGQILRVYCPLLINYTLPLQMPCVNEEPEFLEIVFSKFNIEAEIKALGVIRSFIKKAPLGGTSPEHFSSSTQLIHSSKTAQKLLKLTNMPRAELRIHNFCAEINSEREMKTLELSCSEVSIMKTLKEVELVEVDNARANRAGSRRKPFRTSWSIESMAACERTSLLFELKETSLRSHDIEAPLIEANHLRCNVEVENGRVQPMRIIFVVQSSQLTLFLNLDEAFLWYKLAKAGLEWTPGPSEASEDQVRTGN
ncbi:Oidioi.mRNA.OKI2018_I69.XSR.g16741.t2.cds [Oikopleura dioica]|uniref:Oidioi.mRNA.OKI2018_I69.XSR.g16741.t2.cds n=1 Tax=Oikopleura dioica TaxID=34765 RepID=A0ABN7SHJ8_OIKDI|nr:Oidioi.mRNA.OKI2018_I69.XSR.g16741.t2.cds [Oikopleura dioica]